MSTWPGVWTDVRKLQLDCLMEEYNHKMEILDRIDIKQKKRNVNYVTVSDSCTAVVSSFGVGCCLQGALKKKTQEALNRFHYQKSVSFVDWSVLTE